MSIPSLRRRSSKTISTRYPELIYATKDGQNAGYLDRVLVICPACRKERETSIQSLRITKHSYCRRCSKVKDISGKKFENLTAIKFTGNFQGGKPLWEFLCKCGNIYVGVLTNIKYGTVTSCGCQKNRKGEDHPLFIDITSERYGRLIALEYSHSNRRGAVWKCQCDCGNQCLVASEDIRHGGTRSCGCLFLEGVTGKNNHNWNPDLSQEQREQLRSYPEYHEWIRAVYDRDNYTCQACCSISKGDILAHHLYNYSDYSEYRTELTNGITLCEDCHHAFHINYMGGWAKPCTPDDFYEWKELTYGNAKSMDGH